MVTLKKRVGDKHYETLRTTVELANCYSVSNRPGEAQKLLEPGLELSRTLLGADNPKTMDVMHFLAANLCRRGDMAAGIALHREAIGLCSQRYGDRHEVTKKGRLLLSESFLAAEAWQEAEATINETLQLSIEDGQVVPASQLAAIQVEALIGLGDAERARQIAERQLEILERDLGLNHFRTLEMQTLLAESLAAVNDWSAAATAYQIAIDRQRLLKNRIKHSKMQLAKRLSSLGYCLNQLNAHSKAKLCAAESLEILQREGTSVEEQAAAESVLQAAIAGMREA